MTLWNYDQQPWILEERGGKLASDENTKTTAKFLKQKTNDNQN